MVAVAAGATRRPNSGENLLGNAVQIEHEIWVARFVVFYPSVGHGGRVESPIQFALDPNRRYPYGE
jgi:hypothetical protein